MRILVAFAAVALALGACGASHSSSNTGALASVDGQADIPLYPNARPTGIPPRSGPNATTYTFTLPSGTPVPDVITFYRTEMPKRQWQLATDTAAVLVFAKVGRAAQISVPQTDTLLILVGTGAVTVGSSSTVPLPGATGTPRPRPTPTGTLTTLPRPQPTSTVTFPRPMPTGSTTTRDPNAPLPGQSPGP